MSNSPIQKTQKVTIKTVASDAGVSVAAVSKVMRNAYGVSDSLRDKVLKSIDKLEYRPSTAARAMRGQTMTIGVLLVELANPFLSPLVTGINQVLARANYKTLIGVGESDQSIESDLIRSMTDIQMDGLILIAPRLTGRSLDKFAKRIPMVVVGHHEPDSTTIDTINSDDRFGARQAVEALIEKGYRDIAMLSPPLHHKDAVLTDVFSEREKGYYDAMHAANLGDKIAIHRSTDHEASKHDPSIDRLALSGKLPEAVFVWSDIHAIQLINVARANGIRVPEDLAIVSYDNSPAAAQALIDLSSMDQNVEKLGELAGKTLVSRINGRTTSEHILVTPHLITRSSF